MAERRVRGDGLELAVETWGDPAGPTVVLVHGFPDTHAVWRPVAERLAAAGFHVAAHDVRGAGASAAPADRRGYHVDHLVADLAAVLDEVSPEDPVHLVGHDWGAIQSWQAVGDPNLEHRIASFTSISGLPLDQAARWVRAQVRSGRVVRLARQALRSSYVAWFQVPGVQRTARRAERAIGRSRRRWAGMLRRIEGAEVDEAWPAPTFGADVARGMDLYRANLRPRLGRPAPPRPTPTPVLLIVPTGDRFVPEWLFEGIEAFAPDLRREHVDARHWVVRSRADEVAELIAQHARGSGASPVTGRAARGAG